MTATQRQRVRPRQIGRDRKRQGARGSDRITGREVAVDAKGGLDVVQQLVACLEIAPGGIRRAKRRVQAEAVERFAEAEVQRQSIRRREAEAQPDTRAHMPGSEANLFVTDRDRRT